MNIRTDLALEAHNLYRKNNISKIDGVDVDVEKSEDITKTLVKIINENGAKALGKAIGNYITIEAPDLKYDNTVYESTCKIISDTISTLIDTEIDGITLVVGLGNDKITPDALGMCAVDNIMVTHHIKRQAPHLLEDNISSVCAIKPGVLGTTGMESVNIIKGVCKMLNPDTVIVVDSLAAADIRRVNTTIQICDTGIQPGSGVGNNREGINKEVLGARVIAIGVPTVIDASTISKEPIPEDLAPLMVTTKDIDLTIERMAKTVANGINMALHKGITLSEIADYVG